MTTITAMDISEAHWNCGCPNKTAKPLYFYRLAESICRRVRDEIIRYS